MNWLKAMWCEITSHAWRRARKSEASPFPVRVCKRCGMKQAIQVRARKVSL